MHVGLVLYGGLDEQSGGFRYDRRLVAELRAAGDTVDVIELPWRSYPRGLLDNLSTATAAAIGGDFDVLLQDELAHPSLIRANRRLSSPVVSIVHHLLADEGGRLAPFYRAVERRYLATVDAAVCNSEATQRAVIGTGALVADQTVVAPPAGDRFDPDIDHRRIRERAHEDPFRVIFVGNIEPRKGLDTLVAGLTRVDEPWQLTVVGRATDSDYRREIERQVRTAGCEDRVTFTGRLPDGELETALRRSHVLAIPSRHEGFGIAYLEGLSAGLPAIGTTAGGADDIVTDGETGLLVDPDDPSAVADAVRTLATDRDLLVEMGLAARHHYQSHPNWSVTADRVRDFLADVAGIQRVEVG
jgi:glycosyltransferase involved in cell wall biosynthesis